MTTILILLVKIRAILKNKLDIFGETFKIKISDCQIVLLFYDDPKVHLITLEQIHSNFLIMILVCVK